MSTKTCITQCTILVLAAFALIVGMPLNASAQEGCAASGSIPLLASTGTSCLLHLVPGQQKVITVSVSNTSTTQSGTPVNALLTGTIVYKLACTNTICTTELPNTTQFVPGAADGCLTHVAGVASCAVDGGNANHVLITMDSGGVPLAPGSNPIATFTVQAVTPVGSPAVCGLFGERADTGPNDIVTDDIACIEPATGGAQGSQTENFPPTPMVEITKSCVNGVCGDTSITFTGTVTNTGPTTLSSCTVTDPDCTLVTGSLTGSNIAPLGSFGYTCTKPATPGGPAVDNSASVLCTDVNGATASDDVTSNACTIPPNPSATINKTCVDSNDCDDTGIVFTLTVTNGPVAIAGGTITDAECCSNGATCTFGALGPGGIYQTTCTLPGTAGSTVTNPGSPSVQVTTADQCQSTPSSGPADVSCTIPPPPSATISKTCNNANSCTEDVDFTLTVTNGPVAITGGTITDPECCSNGATCTFGALGPGGIYQTSCTLPFAGDPHVGGSVTNPGAPSVQVTGNQCDSTPSSGQSDVSCTVPGCPCQVQITKTVAADFDCNGTADTAFGESITVDQTQCVVYNICVSNTGQQVLDTNGVEVSDAHLGIVSYDFGTINPAQTVCRLVASEIPAAQCPGGLCVCEDVSGVNTAVISAAICEQTQDSACAQPGSVCNDTAEVICTVPPQLGCRMTGGHNYFAGETEFENDKGTFYTTGGQIGAPTDAGCRLYPQKGKCVDGFCTGGLNGGEACLTNTDCPNDAGKGSTTGPWGDWEHNHHSGPDDTGSVGGGAFSFHSGTAAAPDDAYIKSIICADEGWCVQARPAPNKQIFWEGTGVFENLKEGKTVEPLAFFDACESQPIPFNKKDGYTLHYYRAHVGDFGEPAGTFQNPAEGCFWENGTAYINQCELVPEVSILPATPNEKFSALHPLCLAQDCQDSDTAGCPDWYEIEIHCTADPESPVAYKVGHFIREGNFQLHPPVGSSCNPGCFEDGFCDPAKETCDSCPADCCPQ